MSNTTAIPKMREIAESTLPSKKAHLSVLGDISKEVEVLHSQVLCLTYVRPAKTKGGIHLTDQTIQEDQFQGSIGLVVGLGAGAFKDAPGADFHGTKLKLHDWVMYRAADGTQLFIRGCTCRLFQDTNIMMRVKDPTLYW